MAETLEAVPRQWKVIQTVREKFTCRACEKVSQPPAPFHATPRGWAGPNLLAMILFEKYGAHQPLNRQRDRYAREGIELSLSTLADQVGACTVALRPLHDLIEDRVLAAERLHGDDTPVPVLAKGKCVTGRAWVYVRDDRPFGGADPPAALFRYSRNRSGDHPVEHLKRFTGIFQADIHAGFNRLYEAGRSPGPSSEGRVGRIPGGSSTSSPTSRPASDGARPRRRCGPGGGATRTRPPGCRGCPSPRRRSSPTRARMAPSLCYVDRRDGTLLGACRLPPALHRLGIRHLAVGRGVVVAVAMQYEGPRGDLVTFWDAAGWVSSAPVPDGSGVAPAGRPGELIATGGRGGGFLIDARSGVARPIGSGFLRKGRWDNHLAASASEV